MKYGYVFLRSTQADTYESSETERHVKPHLTERPVCSGFGNVFDRKSR